MTAPTEVTAQTSRVKTTFPLEGNVVAPRDPVSPRAQIGSLAEDRKREIEKRMSGLVEEYRRLALELVAMQGAACFVGISNGEDGVE